MRRSRRLSRRLPVILTAVAAVAVLPTVTQPDRAAPLPSAAAATGAGRGTSSYIVTLAPGAGIRAPSVAGRNLARSYGARIRHTYGAVLNGYAVQADATAAARLAADPRIASVVPDGTVRLDRTPPVASWPRGLPTGPDRPAGAPPGPRGGGRGATVYVIDTGVRTSHRDFGGRARSGWDFVDGDAIAQDGNGHGTHVAAIAAGGANGVARQADVVAVRVLDDTGTGTTSRVIAGIDWVTEHARKPAVANLSLGGRAGHQLDAAVRHSIASGVTYTVAAGNEGRPAALFSPARVREAITVGAADARGARAASSNWGTSVDLFAPGVGIDSAWHTGDTARRTLSGTSMAAPHAAGAAALYLAGHPRATPAEVGRALARAARGNVADAGPGSPNRLLQVTG
ncbi:S8 family peptidase [Streptomyces sp. NPDC059169]|uniref:S8 family peptidase n=1 Tax=unclassified Streptomyces TaxID=2593676 RepID=UPI0036BFCE9B